MTPDVLIAAALVLPLVMAVLIALFGKAPDLREGVTVLGGMGLFALVVQLAMQVAGGARPELYVGETVPGLAIVFRLEPLGALFALVASALWIVNSIYSIGYMRGNRERNQTRFYICFAVAMTGAMGVAMAGNLFTLFVFYEVLTLSTYPLVAHKGDVAAQRGARMYLLTLLGTSIAFFLTAIMWTWAVTGQRLDFVEGGLLAQANLSPAVASALLLLFVFGAGKAALMPFHFWLPGAMVAPTPVSAFLHAVAVVKAGVFVVLKVSIYIFGFDLLQVTPARDWLIGVAAFTILAASLIALTQDNLKSRLAYSTVAQLAYVTLGALLAVQAGALGGALQIVTHAAAKITLFMCAGAIYVATGLTEVSAMRGLGRKMPLIFIAFFIASLSIIGIPPLAGGWPKFELLQGAIDAGDDWLTGVLIVSALLNVAYLLPVSILALMPPEGTPPPREYKRPGGAPALAVAAPVFTAGLCIALFFAIGPIGDFLAPVFQTAESLPAEVLP